MGQNLPATPRPSPSALESQSGAIVQQQRSIAVQRQSVERQRAAAGAPSRPSFSRYASSPDALGARLDYQPDCPPVPSMLLASIVHKAAAANRLSPSLVDAVIRQESGGYPCAVSDKGALGLMQLMPATAAQMGVSEPFDVTQNVDAGTRLLADLMERYHGDLNRVLGAYNAGPAAVDRAGGPPPLPETLSYIHSILEQIKQPFDPKPFASPIR